MTWLQAIGNYLAGDAGVAALVGDRVTIELTPETERPALTLAFPDETYDPAMLPGPVNGQGCDTGFAFTAWAEFLADAEELALAVRVALRTAGYGSVSSLIDAGIRGITVEGTERVYVLPDDGESFGVWSVTVTGTIRRVEEV